MTSVACRVPEALAAGDLWQILKAAVRRHDDPEDDRLLVADSKLVYSTTRGLAGLEASVAATLVPSGNGQLLTLAQYIDWACPAAHAELRQEHWYTGTSTLPVVANPEEFRPASERFRESCSQAQVVWGLLRSVVICPARFNQILERWDSKGAVLAHGLADLLACNRVLAGPGDALHFFIDKHGGRNTYAAMLQNALPDGMVVAEEEGRARSVYGLRGLTHDIRVTFQPRADLEHFAVALASMFSKYLRELFMLEFNRFWKNHLPELKATAGYPGDAARFFAEIRPVALKLGIPETVLWRRR
jgi:hypothetical protein